MARRSRAKASAEAEAPKAPAAPPDPRPKNGEEGVTLAIAHADFAKDTAGPLRLLMLALMIAIGTSALGAFVLFSRPVESVFFPMTPDDEPLDARNLLLGNPPVSDRPDPSDEYFPDARVLTWSARAISDSLTFDFNDYVLRVRDAYAAYFTTQGQRSHLSFMQQSLLNTVRSDLLVIQTRLRDMPAICDRGLRDGIYSWLIEMPIRIRTHDVRQEGQGFIRRDAPLRFTAIVTVVRRPITDATPAGLGIERVRFVNIEARSERERGWLTRRPCSDAPEQLAEW